MIRYLPLFFIILIFACNKEPVGGGYFPAKDGNWWRYQKTGTTGHFTTKFSKTTTLDNGDTAQNFIIVDTTSTPYSFDTLYVVINDTVVAFFEETDAEPHIFLKFPLEVNKNWYYIVDEESIKVAIESESDVSVPGGNFSNVFKVKYENKETEDIWTIYYAQSVGIIKLEGDLFFIEEGELLDYFVNEE